MAESTVLERSEASAKSPLAGIKVVDTDTHITEAYDLWTSRAPAAFKHRVPYAKKMETGIAWFIEGDVSLGAYSAASAIRKDGYKSKGWEFIKWGNEDVTPGSYDVKSRLAYMDKHGIDAQIAYTNVLGFGGQKAMMVDPELRLLCTQILNDALAEFQQDSGNRIYPMALLPWWDPKLAAEEAKRCNDMGLRGINMNSDPHNHAGLPPLSGECWDPLWKLCSERSMPINFHIGASDESNTWFGAGQWPGKPEDHQLAFGTLMLFLGNMRVMANIIMDGFLDRFPELKIVSVESGAGWVPYLLEALEYQMAEAGMDNFTPATEVFRRQIYVCAWFEKKNFASTLRQIGADNVLFETDYPHPTCLYPDPMNYLGDVLEELTFDERKKFFGETARRIYNLDI